MIAVCFTAIPRAGRGRRWMARACTHSRHRGRRLGRPLENDRIGVVAAGGLYYVHSGIDGVEGEATELLTGLASFRCAALSVDRSSWRSAARAVPSFDRHPHGRQRPALVMPAR